MRFGTQLIATTGWKTIALASTDSCIAKSQVLQTCFNEALWLTEALSEP